MNKNQKFPKGWKEVKLGEIGKFVSGTGFPESEQGGKNGIPFYKVSDMNLEKNNKEMLVANNYVNQEQIIRLKYKPIKEDAIIFAKVGAAIFLERKRLAKNFLIDNNMMAFIPINANLHFMKIILDKTRLSKFSQIGALPSYNASDLKIIKIAVPADIEEQKAIAGALGIWDVGIEKLSQVIKLKEKQKKAIMQKLLSGKIRLSGFSKPWKEVKLGEVCEIKKGKQLGRLEMLENGSVPVMNGGILPSGFTNSFNENENTITISEGGNSCGFVSLLKEKFWCGGHCYVLKNLKVEILFLFQILKQKEQEIMRLRVGSGLPNIQKTVIEKFSFYVPADIDEQCAIAGTLSVCDEELALLNKKLALLREQKKSLMQQLLTGKMRLKF